MADLATAVPAPALSEVSNEAGEEPFGARYGLTDGGRAVAPFADHDAADADDGPLAVGHITFDVALVLGAVELRHQPRHIQSDHVVRSTTK